MELVVVALLAALSAGMAVGAVSARRTTARMAAAAEALLAAQPDALSPAALPGNLHDVFGRVAGRLASAELLATTDQLTGVMNRQACLQSLDAEVTRASRHDRSLAVALVDIDHFKKVNDTYGHAAGDIVLHHVAQLLRSNLRTTDILGRYGGEEFLLALPETEVEGATEVVEKLRRLVGGSAIGLPDGGELAVTISIGLAVGAGRVLGLAQMTRDADGALYAAKAMGRDQVYLFREVDENRVLQRTPLSAASRQTASEAGQAAADAAHQQLAKILAPRPGWAGQPSSLIAELAVGLGQGVGLADREVARIRTASLLHDVGKITIPEELLSKRTTLSQEEWRMIREHPKTGQMILEQAGALRDAAGIALHHHEWFNGRGYPNGLAARDIPIGARIVAIADAYEAMTSWRPYKQTKMPEEAIAELGRCRGTQFDPELVELFVSLFGDVLIAQSQSDVSAAAG